MIAGFKILSRATFILYAVAFVINLGIVYTTVSNDPEKRPHSLIGHAYIQTPTAEIISDIKRNRRFQDDPTFDIAPYVDRLMEVYPARYWHMLQSVGSEDELHYMVDRMNSYVAADEYLTHTSPTKRGIAEFMVRAADPVIVAAVLFVFFMFSLIVKALVNGIKRKVFAKV